MSKPYFPKLNADFARLLDRLTRQPAAVVGHARPDGDCIGAQVALTRLLASRGADVVCVNGDAVPRRLDYLVSDVSFLRTDAAIPVAKGRAAVFVDCADLGRVGNRLDKVFPQPIGCIDHHLSNLGFAEINLVDSDSAATCEILAGLMLDLDLPIDGVTARALYAGIMTDTGQFRFHSTSRRCFELAGELVDRGADPAEAGHELYERESLGKYQLLQRFLASLKLECGGRVCIGYIPLGSFEETGTTVEDTEGLVDYARSIDGVDVGVLIEEKPGGSLKASLRSTEPVWRLDQVAAQFNGGGHACAAGLNLPGTVETFRPQLIAALERQVAVVQAGKQA